jgi:ATP-dependent RNA helicase DeaD
LLATKSPEQIAAAFFRQNQIRRPTPEEFVDSGGDAGEAETPRNDFDDGVWFKLSVGRKQRAESRRAGYCHSFARPAESPSATSAPSKSSKPRAWLR